VRTKVTRPKPTGASEASISSGRASTFQAGSAESTKSDICSTDYMHETLKYFSKEEMYEWWHEIQTIDGVISGSIKEAFARIAANKTKIPSELVKSLQRQLKRAGIRTDYDLRHIEVFHGYVYYVYPDNGLKTIQTGNCDLNYGIAKATVQGLPHRHFESPAYNYILDGEGVFTGDPLERGMFRSFYHGKRLKRDVQLEIPVGMTHGHLVKRGSVLWLLAVQECSFAPDKGCAGDFHFLPNYDLRIFGTGYQ
jgi:hypothetical protein